MSNCPCMLCSPPVGLVSRQTYDIEWKPYTRAMLHGREQERIAIVAWLREMSDKPHYGEVFADFISEGEHLKGEEDE